MSCSKHWGTGQNLHYLRETGALTKSQEKEDLMPVVCLYFCPIVGNLENSEMFKEAAKSSCLRFRLFHQTCLSSSVSSFKSFH